MQVVLTIEGLTDEQRDLVVAGNQITLTGSVDMMFVRDTFISNALDKAEKYDDAIEQGKLVEELDNE